MLGFTNTELLDLLTQYGYGIVFPVSILEGPIVATLSGFLVSLGVFNFIFVTLVLVLGDLVGDTLYYLLGRSFRRKKVPRWLRFVGIRDDNVQRFEGYFHKHDWKIILLGKTQAVGAAILFSAGFAKLPYKKYMLYNLLGSAPKVLLFEAIGYYFGRAYSEFDSYLNTIGILSFLFAGFMLLAYFLFKRYLKSHYAELKNE